MHNFQSQIVPTISLGASGATNSSYTFDIDLITLSTNTTNLTGLLFQQIGGAIGAILSMQMGFGNSDPNASGTLPVVIGGSSKATYSSTIYNYTLNLGNSELGMLLQFIPRWVRVTLTNQDPINAIQLNVMADI